MRRLSYAPDGGAGGRGRTFYEVVTAAIADITENGFDSQERLDYWVERIRRSAQETFASPEVLERELRASLTQIYARMVERGGVLKMHPDVSRFTIDRIRPKLRTELDRRIMTSAQLIKINREQRMAQTLQRFTGWTTSIPAGGSKVVDKIDVKSDIRKALAQLPFEERRVAIDQGHKLIASINEVVALDSGAIVMRWNSTWRRPGYNFRVEHKERDGKFYAIRGCWALEKGFMKAGPDGYADEITRPAEEPFCSCYGTFYSALRYLPDNMLTDKGREEMARVRSEVARLKTKRAA